MDEKSGDAESGTELFPNLDEREKHLKVKERGPMTIRPVTTAAAPANVPADSSRGASITTSVVEASQLPQYEAAWEGLSEKAVVTNVFYEPWMMLPAIDLHTNREDLRFLLVFGPQQIDGLKPLWGLFPLELQSRCMHLPIRALAFWQHRWCYLNVPLIDAEHVWETLEAFWRWFERNPFGTRILDTNLLPGDGPFGPIWADFAIGRTSMMLSDYPRGLLKPSGTAKAYIANAVSKRHQYEYERQARRLAEMGKVEYCLVESVSDVDAWLDQFLALESDGWKGGATGAAFAKHAADMSYFRSVTRDGFLRNRVTLRSLVLDGKVIAMKHNLLAGDGAFALRIAFDEKYYKYSPGLLLEIENIRQVCANSRTKWVDSCTQPRSKLYNRIWTERRMIRRTLFSDSSRLGDFWISILPLLRWIKKRIKPNTEPAYLQISTRKDAKA
jgi:CelD/BcsL family acetyltransferase involved in cellulose biosynthesis